MKKKSAKTSGLSREEILAAEQTRQACNQLTREERRRLSEAGFRIIYGADLINTPLQRGV